MSVVFLFLFPVLLAATEEPASALSTQMVFAACKTVCGGSRYVGVEFCIEALGSVSGGDESLDYQRFGGLAVGLLADNATSTKSKIDRLLQGGGANAVVARSLLSCQSLYGGIVNGGPACTAAVKAGKLGEAEAILEKAAAAAKECEDGFGKNKAASPLSAENDDAFQLAKLGVGMLKNA
jgi:pectinesterase inhibitor-like protein